MAAVYDSSTGIYIDPQTGAASLDPYGTQAVQNPSLIQQAKRNLAVSHGLLENLAGYGKTFTNAVGGEEALSKHLADVIAGRAPSVANAQLQQGLGEIRQQADSEASGATGVNAALARMTATQTAGDASARANQTASLIRAQEIANAERNQGAVLGNIAGQSTQMYGTNLQGAQGFSGLAGNEAAEQAKIDAERDAANKRLIANIIAGAGATAATIATGGAAAPVAGAALAGIASGQAGNSAASSAGDVTAGLPSSVPSTGVTNEDLIGTTSALSAPSAAETHSLVGGLDTTKSDLVNTGLGLSSGTAYTSDRREKTDVKPAPMQDFLDKLASFSFEYKHPGTQGEPAGPRVGVMAQDMAKTPVGRTAVIPGSPMKLDMGNATGLALAAVAHLNKEIKKLKGQA